MLFLLKIQRQILQHLYYVKSSLAGIVYPARLNAAMLPLFYSLLIS